MFYWTFQYSLKKAQQPFRPKGGTKYQVLEGHVIAKDEAEAMQKVHHFLSERGLAQEPRKIKQYAIATVSGLKAAKVWKNLTISEMQEVLAFDIEQTAKLISAVNETVKSAEREYRRQSRIVAPSLVRLESWETDSPAIASTRPRDTRLDSIFPNDF